MIASTISRLLVASAYRKVIAVLLAGCVAGFVLGQAAHQQPRGIAAAVTSPPRTAAVIAGALGTPVVAPPRVIVPLSAPRAQPTDGGDKHVRDADPHNHEQPHEMPLGRPGHGHGDSHDGGHDHGGDTPSAANPTGSGVASPTITLSVSD